MEAGSLNKDVVELIKKGERDLTTMVTYSIKVYVTPEVVAAYPNYTESVEYLIEIVNNQYKSTIEELRGSADVAALFGTNVAGGAAWSSNPPNGNTMVLVNNLQQSLHTRIVFGHELGHTFGAKHEDGFRFKVGEKQLGTLMHTAETEGHCCTDDYGFYSNPEVKINGTATGDKKHNVAAMIRTHRFLVAAFGDESLTCGGPLPSPLPEPPVSCGSHEASSCRGCPQGNGEAWCNGDCQQVKESCVKK